MRETKSGKRNLVYGVVSVEPTEKPIIRELALHARKTGRRLLAYHPKDLNAVLTSNRRRVWTHEYDVTRKKWIRKMGPVPDVILRDFRNSDWHAEIKKAMQHLTVYVNPITPVQIVKDKARFSAVMKQGGVPHPETTLYSPETVHAFLNEHGAVYLKDRKGSRGIGILRVEDMGNNSARVEYKKQDEWTTQTIPKAELTETLETIIGRFRQPDSTQYVVQQEIRTPTLEGKKFSIRINMHRTADGHVVSGGFATIAEPGSVVANLVQGGQLVPYQKALRSVYGTGYVEVRNELVDACRRAFLSVEKESRLHTSLPMGELGFDVVFQGKKPYVLEANSRPVVEPGDPHIKKYMENLFRAGQHVYQVATRGRR